jgi:beta-galactosidase
MKDSTQAVDGAAGAARAFPRREFLGSALLAAVPWPAAAQTAGGLLDEIHLGAEFFLNRTETRDSVFAHFRRMAETGLTVARIFTLWDHVERERGQWDFRAYDWIYDAAAKHGLQIANTLCAEDPPGWMGTSPFYHQWRDLANPALRAAARVYLEKVVTHYRQHPAHGVWLLQNEPGIIEPDNSSLLPPFARWLERKYGSVDNLNRGWYRPLKRFDDAPLPVPPRQVGWPDYPSNLDWLRFRCDHLADQLRWIHAEIDRHHPGALTHINPPGQTGNMPASGRDMWRLKPTAHFLGASMHAAWHFGQYARDEFGVAYGYCCDLVRSASAPAPYWVTELQAGTTVFTGSRPLNPSADEIRRWLWDGIGNSARGIVFWLWHPRTEGNEAGEWAMAGPGGEETPRTRATREVAEALRAQREFFRAARQAPARVAILYNREAMLLYAVDAWRRPGDELMSSLLGCYKALHRAHVPLDFLESGELETGGAKRYDVLYLPYCYARTARASEQVREFVRAGGVVWADGLVAWKDEEGVTRQLPPGPLSDVFGFTATDIDPVWEPFDVSARGDRAGQNWRCRIPAGGYQALHRDGNGEATATENSFGKGKAIYYATALTLGYMLRGGEETQAMIAAPGLRAAEKMPVRVLEAPRGTSFRALENAGRRAIVLNNWGQRGPVRVRVRGALRSAERVVGSGPVTLERGAEESFLRLELEAGGTAIVITG